MTTVEEDLLLNEPVATEYDGLTVLYKTAKFTLKNTNFQAIDEDFLLGAGDVSRKGTQESTDDLLGSSEPFDQEDILDTVPEQVS